MGYIRKLINKETFNPSWVGMLVNPFYFARKGLYKGIRKSSEKISGRILDVGCGRKPYKELFSYTQYLGIDIDNPGHSHENEDVDIFYDGRKFPLDNDSFDSIICNQVLEHVFTPDELLQEINRVLRNDGYLLLTVPFVWDEHEQPNDYARYSSFGIKYLLEKNGFRIEHNEKSVNSLSVIFQLINAYFYKKLMTRGKLLHYMAMLFLIFPVNLIGSIISGIFPDNDDLYLDNIILAKKI